MDENFISNNIIDVAAEEAKKIAYEQRKKEENEYLEEQDLILDIDISKKELQLARKQAEDISKYYVYDIWKRLFNKVSFYNEIPCQVLFHVLLGQLLSKKKIRQVADFQDFRVHFIWIQDPGTGKGTAWNFFSRIARRLKNYDNEEMKLYSSGVDTTAAIIDSFVLDNRGRATNQIRPGIVSSHDIIMWEEAVSLFRPTNEFSNGTVRVVLDVVEPYGSPNNIHTKALQHWPRPTQTISSASLIATSRPIQRLRGEVLYSGLFQRFLTYIRKVDHILNNKMIQASSLSSFGDGIEQFQKQEEELIKELKKLQKFGKENELEPHPKDRVLKLISEKMEILEEDCWNQIGNDNNRSIVESFIRRMRNYLVKLACHSAIMRESTKIELKDIEYGFELIQKLYNSLKIWIELDIAEEEDKGYLIKINTVIRIIKEYNKNNKRLQKPELAKIISKECKFSLQSAYALLSRMSQGSNSYIIFAADKTVRLN